MPKSLLLKVLLPIGVIVALAVGGLYLIKNMSGRHSHSGSGAVEVRAGATLPDFELIRMAAGDAREKVLLSELGAKVYLINFWASWCEACLTEMPSIVELRKSFVDKGFEVLAINVDENPSAVVPPLASKLGMNFPVYLDPEQKLAELFDVHAIPLTVIIDKDRKILLVQSGEKNWNSSDIRYQLEQWLGS